MIKRSNTLNNITIKQGKTCFYTLLYINPHTLNATFSVNFAKITVMSATISIGYTQFDVPKSDRYILSEI